MFNVECRMQYQVWLPSLRRAFSILNIKINVARGTGHARMVTSMVTQKTEIRTMARYCH